jgi:hypothetical protein
MEKEQLIERIRSAGIEGKISCSQALAIAREAKVSTREVGDLLNELKIKVKSCQLGCFP